MSDTQGVLAAVLLAYIALLTWLEFAPPFGSRHEDFFLLSVSEVTQFSY